MPSKLKTWRVLLAAATIFAFFPACETSIPGNAEGYEGRKFYSIDPSYDDPVRGVLAEIGANKYQLSGDLCQAGIKCDLTADEITISYNGLVAAINVLANIFERKDAPPVEGTLVDRYKTVWCRTTDRSEKEFFVDKTTVEDIYTASVYFKADLPNPLSYLVEIVQHTQQFYNYVIRSVESNPRTFFARVEGTPDTLNANQFPGEWAYTHPNTGVASPIHTILCRLLK